MQRLVLYASPLVLGGGLSWCDGLNRSLAGAARGRVASLERVGPDARLIVEMED